jgi:hypothetical protein
MLILALIFAISISRNTKSRVLLRAKETKGEKLE